jgi:hypothetical protein
MSDRQPMAFLVLVTGQDGAYYEVVVLHRLMRYMDLPGDDPSGFHDRVLGLLGDILRPRKPSYYLDGTLQCWCRGGAFIPSKRTLS